MHPTREPERQLQLEAACFRAVYRAYRDDPLPSRSPSGRFHAREGGGSVTYLAASPETAWKEVTERWAADRGAYWMVEVTVRLSRVADLTDSAVQARYGVDQRVLTDPRHERCQQLGQRLREDGFEGLLTFSRADRPSGRQLVVFLDRLGAGSRVRVKSVKPVRNMVLRPEGE